MSVSVSSIAYALKRLYPQRRIENLVYQDNPLLAMIPKEGNFEGAVIALATRYADTMGRSADFSTAQTRGQATNNNGVQFLVNRVKDYQLYTLETEAILAGKSDRGALVQTLDTEVSSALNNIGRSQAMALYRDGVGDIGSVASISGAGPFTVTLANPNDITNFEYGQMVVVSTGSTRTAILRNSGGGVAITGVDRDAGTFTIATNPDTITAGDYLFLKGDRQVAAITANTQWLRMSGLEAWNPSAAPTAGDSFFSVDRSVDASRLAGLRIDISAYNPEEGLVIALNRLAREGGRPSNLFLNYVDARNIQLALGSKAETVYQQVGDIGFSSIRIRGPKGDVTITPDQNAPSGVGRLLTLSTWKLRHLGDLVNVLDMDGSRLLRESSADRFEGRMAFYGNLTCNAPGLNARLIMPT